MVSERFVIFYSVLLLGQKVGVKTEVACYVVVVVRSVSTGKNDGEDTSNAKLPSSHESVSEYAHPHDVSTRDQVTRWSALFIITFCLICFTSQQIMSSLSSPTGL